MAVGVAVAVGVGVAGGVAVAVGVGVGPAGGVPMLVITDEDCSHGASGSCPPRAT